MSQQSANNDPTYNRSNNSSAAPLELSHHASLQWSQHNPSSNLRHRTDYERIRSLGTGAFGTTHLVKSCIDKHCYALKCVRLVRDGDESSKVLREVNALSALRSDHVVRYYTAWVERGELEQERDRDASYDDELDNYSSSFTNDHSSTAIAAPFEEICNLCHERYKDWIISCEKWGLIDAVLQPLNLCTSCYINSLPGHIDASSIDIREKTILPECLYILMEYGGDTLSDVMRTLSKDDDSIRWSLFAQCVQGLYSIHEQGFYHRDIKPGNIFVQNGIAKIGDLGLSADARSENNAIAGSSGVGTYLYCAPEVEEGLYCKADIFSLGVVLIELFSDFTTGMERVKVLSRIRNGDIPIEWRANTDEGILARMMVDEILQHLVQRGRLTDPDSSVLLGVIRELQNCVDGLERVVKQKNDEIERLRSLLASNGINIQEVR